MTAFDAPDHLPKGTPKPIGKIYLSAFVVAAFLAVAAFGLSKIPPVMSGLVDSCRALQLCSPPPLKPLAPLATGWLPSGSTWASASQSLLDKHRQENPDYDIEFHPGREYSKSGLFNSNVEYRFEGTFSGTPHWRGLFDIVDSWLVGGGTQH